MSDAQEQSPQVVTMTINDLIYAQVKDLGKRMDRIENRMDKLETRLEKLDEKLETTRKDLSVRMDKQDEKIEKLADKIDSLHRDIKSSSSHGQIITVSAISLAVGVLLAIFFR